MNVYNEILAFVNVVRIIRLTLHTSDVGMIRRGTSKSYRIGCKPWQV